MRNCRNSELRVNFPLRAVPETKNFDHCLTHVSACQSPTHLAP